LFVKIIFKGSMELDEGPEYDRYVEGVGMGCWGLFVYSSSSAVYACKKKNKTLESNETQI